MFKSRLYLLAFLLLTQFFLVQPDAFAQKSNFKTRYTDIYYSDDKSFSDFLWRISGKRFDLVEDMSLAKSRVDRIVERVQSLLDMVPDNFRIRIYLYPVYKNGMIASYSHKASSITVYADKVTDGVFAHEVAHAVICNYFEDPPPQKVQEILAQYVDKHLWRDY